MKIKNIITLEQLKKAYAEEYREVVAERIHDYIDQGGRMDEDFLQKVQGGAKGFMKGYGKLIQNYGNFVAGLYGVDGAEELPPEVQPPPEDDMEQAMRDQDAAAADELITKIQQQIDAMKAKAAETGQQDKVAGIENYADKLETAVDSEQGGGETTPDSAALLDMIDKVQGEWDAVEKKTQDKKLKQAMDYIEKVAVAEKLTHTGRKK